VFGIVGIVWYSWTRLFMFVTFVLYTWLKNVYYSHKRQFQNPCL